MNMIIVLTLTTYCLVISNGYNPLIDNLLPLINLLAWL